jgi:hypothetical protein
VEKPIQDGPEADGVENTEEIDPIPLTIMKSKKVLPYSFRL